VVLVAVALLGWAGLSLANNWVRTQYYVGNSAGEVAIFQGLSQEVGPIRLSELHDTPGGLPVDALPALYRDQVEGTMQADSIDHAQQIVRDLRREACNASDLPRPDDEQNENSEPTGPPDPTAEPP
jgi:protein phosphatase